MVVYVICGHCRQGYNPQTAGHDCQNRWTNAQLGAGEKPMLWVNPKTGEIKYPMQNDHQMPARYNAQGFTKVEFNSYQEHKAFCNRNGLVNHKIEGVSVDKDSQKSRFGY